MQKKRVVVTGISAITSLGDCWSDFKSALMDGKTAVKHIDAWSGIKELHCHLAAPLPEFTLPKHYTRKKLRTMGKVSRLAVRSAELALTDAGLLDHELIKSGACGVSYGSCTGSTDAMQDFTKLMSEHDISNINATTYIRMMSYTAAANIAIFFNLKGRVIATSTACTSGSQGIGYAFEAIQHGKQKVMLAGGAEELCPSEVAIFDTLYATSTKNGYPEATPRPFDKDRDGLVVGEGACTFVLEEFEHAQARGAPILAELVGYATNCDGAHATQPMAETMAEVMRMSLYDADLPSSSVSYVNAHGTGTKIGDAAESHATNSIFGPEISISSLKGNIGHTLGGCGAIEAWASIHMMNDNWFAPTHNLKTVGSECADLNYIVEQGTELQANHVMTNNFAFGGVNTSLIFKRWVC